MWNHIISLCFLYPLIVGSLNKYHSITILFSWLVHLLLLPMTGFAWWRPMFLCREHRPDKGPCSACRDSFTSLVSISLLDIIHSYNWGLGLRCLHTSIFIETLSLERLPLSPWDKTMPWWTSTQYFLVSKNYYFYYYYHY